MKRPCFSLNDSSWWTNGRDISIEWHIDHIGMGRSYLLIVSAGVLQVSSRCPPGVLQVSSRCPPSLDWDLFPIGNEIRKKLLQQIGLIGYTPRDTESLWWSQCTACQRRFQLKGSLVPRCPGSAQTGKGPPTHTSANHPHTDTEILQIYYIYICVCVLCIYIYIYKYDIKLAISSLQSWQETLETIQNIRNIISESRMQGPSECRLRGQFERRKHQWKVFRHIRQKQKNAILLCGRVKTVLNFSKTKIMEMYWSDRANNCRWGCVERQPIFRRVPCMHVQSTKTSLCKHFADLFHSHIHLASDPDSVWPSAKLETSRNI